MKSLSGGSSPTTPPTGSNGNVNTTESTTSRRIPYFYSRDNALVAKIIIGSFILFSATTAVLTTSPIPSSTDVPTTTPDGC